MTAKPKGGVPTFYYLKVNGEVIMANLVERPVLSWISLKEASWYLDGTGYAITKDGLILTVGKDETVIKYTDGVDDAYGWAFHSIVTDLVGREIASEFGGDYGSTLTCPNAWRDPNPKYVGLESVRHMNFK